MRRARKCEKGYACGDACIERADACPSQASDAASKALDGITKLIDAKAELTPENANAIIYKALGGKNIPTAKKLADWQKATDGDPIKFAAYVQGHIDYWQARAKTKAKIETPDKAADAIVAKLPEIAKTTDEASANFKTDADVRSHIKAKLAGKNVPTAKTIAKWADEAGGYDKIAERVDGHVAYWSKLGKIAEKVETSAKAAEEIVASIPRGESKLDDKPDEVRKDFSADAGKAAVHEAMGKSRALTYKKRLDNIRSQLVKEFGEEDLALIEAGMAKALANSKIYSRADESVVMQILDDRLKTLFETGTSKGLKNKSIRAKVEKGAILGPEYAKKANKDPSERAIYGYFEDNTERAWNTGNGYGDAMFVIKNSKKADATFTSDDSLFGYVASALDKPNVASYINGYEEYGDETELTSWQIKNSGIKELIEKAKTSKLDSIADIKPKGYLYIEAQIQGKVTNKDIEALHFKKKPNDAIIAKCKALGIELIYPSSGESKLDAPGKIEASSFIKAIADDKQIAKLEAEIKIDENTKLKANEALQKAMAKASVFVRVPNAKIADLILDDRWKSVGESGKTIGTDTSYKRSKTEPRIFSQAYAEKVAEDPSQLAIYGYAADNIRHAQGQAFLFGDVICELKQEIKAKATMTMGDSLGDGIKASPAESPSFVSVDREKDKAKIAKQLAKLENPTIQQIRDAAELKSDYIEMQMHGQLKNSDIAALHFTQAKPPNALIAKAKAMGIKIYHEGELLN